MSTSAGTRGPDARRPDDSYLARLFEDDSHAWTRTRAVRRRLVLAEVGLLAALAALIGWAATTQDGGSLAVTVAWCLGMLVFIPLHSLLNSGIRGLFDRRLRTLDEHQRRLRAESYAAATPGAQALTFAAAACGIAVVAVTDHTALGLWLAFLLWFAAGLLPYWRLSWTLPDEDPAA